MESSNTDTDSQLNQVKEEESKDDLPATIKQELKSSMKFSDNSNHHTSENIDALSSIKKEREYDYDDVSNIESSNTSTNSLLHQVKHEPASMDLVKSEDILLGTIKLEIFETEPVCPPNSNQQVSDVLFPVKTETEYSDHDHLHIFNTDKDTKRWTVTSSTVIPLVKREHSLGPYHEVFESIQPGGAMQAPTLGTDLLSKSAISNNTHPQCASKLSLLNSDAEKGRLNSLALNVVDTEESMDEYESISKTNQDKGLPQGETNTSTHRGVASKGHLSQHQLVHTRKRAYKCSLCGKCFTRKHHLSQHQRLHTGEKPFKCTVCEKEFTHSGNLTVHMRIHTGEKPYKCSVCSKAFTLSGDLIRHQRIHTGEKPYKCSVCGKDFMDLSRLTIHLRVHLEEKPYKCSVCEKELCTAHSLNQHRRIHTGEKPYKCSICGKEFSHSANLKRHQLTHTGEKPHKCSVCDKRFIRKDHLSAHQRVHTGEKP